MLKKTPTLNLSLVFLNTKVDRNEVIEQESDSTSVDTKKKKKNFQNKRLFIGKEKNRLKELFNSLIKEIDWISQYSIRAIFTTMKLSTLPM